MPEPLQPVDLSAYLAQPGEAEREFRRMFRAGDPLYVCNIGDDSVRDAPAMSPGRGSSPLSRPPPTSPWSGPPEIAESTFPR